MTVSDVAKACCVSSPAAVNGSAVGWGMELALYADIRIASEKAVFAELFVKRGLVCDVGGFWKLPSIVGPAKAAELLMTGDLIDANEAHRIGLAEKVVPAGQVLSTAMDLARQIARNPRLAVRAIKRAVNYDNEGLDSGTDAVAFEADLFARTWISEDHNEAVEARKQKRVANFRGR